MLVCIIHYILLKGRKLLEPTATTIITTLTDVDGTEVDADDESLNEESLQEISGELQGQEIAEAKLDELQEVEDFHAHCAWIR